VLPPGTPVTLTAHVALTAKREGDDNSGICRQTIRYGDWGEITSEIAIEMHLGQESRRNCLDANTVTVAGKIGEDLPISYSLFISTFAFLEDSPGADGTSGLGAEIDAIHTARLTLIPDGDFTFNTASGNDLSGVAITRDGFYSPVDSDLPNIVKAGSTVPLKFDVFVNDVEKMDTDGLELRDTQVSCATGEEGPITATPSAQPRLRYDWNARQFTANWRVPNNPGACYSVRMVTSADGGSLRARFDVK
jgi:hypothetical protein